MKIKGILFDVNGTLVDIKTDEGKKEIYESICRLLAYQGILIGRDELKTLYFQIMKRQLKSSNENHPEFDAVSIFREIINLKREKYTDTISDEKLNIMPGIIAELYRGMSMEKLRLYPGVISTLDKLKKHYSLAIVTDAQSAYAIAELNQAGLLDYFNPIIVSGDYGYRKPERKLFAKAIESLKINANETVYVGNDMYRDIYGARELGIKTVFFVTETGEKSYKDTEADYVIRDFSDLNKAVDFLEKNH